VSATASLALRRGGTLADDLLRSLRAHLWLIAPIEAYVIVAYGIALILGKPGSFSLLGYERAFAVATPVLAGGFLVVRASYLMLVVRPHRLIHAIIDDLRCNWLTRERLLHGLPVVLVLPLFSSACTLLKTLIPDMHPYDWDATLAGWDSAVHFGMAPWRLLQPIFGYPVMTGFANVIYCFWFFGLAGLWFWQAFALRDRQLRIQYFISYMLCFALLGNFAATLLASGGPCFYGRMVLGPDPYAPLMQYLRGVSVGSPVNISVGLQDMLWQRYVMDADGVGSGIAAMPSLHVAGATLFALLGWRTNRILGGVLTVFVALVLMATVHLGWHYAIDGYAAIVATLAIWSAVGAVIRLCTGQSARVAGLPVEVGAFAD